MVEAVPVAIFARTCGLIQGFSLLLGLVLPTWSEAEDLRMLLNCEIWTEMLCSSGSCCICDSILLVKADQSMPLQHHLAFLGATGWYLILWLMAMKIGRWSELPIGSASDHDVLVDQLWPQIEKLGVLSFPVTWLVRVVEPSIKTCRSLLMIQSVILLPWASGGWTWCQRCKWLLKSPMMMERGDGLRKFGSKWVCWVVVLRVYMLFISIHNDFDVQTQIESIRFPCLLFQEIVAFQRSRHCR